MSSPVSPLAPKAYPDLPSIPGVRLATRACGVKYQGRTDVLLVDFIPGTAVAGVFTKSLTASASVLQGRANLKAGTARALVVNSGNSNAFTGKAGEESVERIHGEASRVMNCGLDEVFSSSTGVIGEPLPHERITDVLAAMTADLSDASWEDAAKAIMTTDTYHKMATRTVEIGGVEVTINGIAKGSGMIAPDMATMLAYVATDANIPTAILQEMLDGDVQTSFNAITVDSDTSTSDTLMAFATGMAGNKAPKSLHDEALSEFRAAFQSLLTELAHLIVRDGEGATKFVTISLSGAENDRAAKVIALTIANSPLVKTAIAGEDANWGRIVMAVGKAGEKADRDKLDIRIGGVQLTEGGQVVDGYDEAPVTAHMKGQEIDVAVDVGIANGSSTVWTCDLTHGYITINADYRS